MQQTITDLKNAMSKDLSGFQSDPLLAFDLKKAFEYDLRVFSLMKADRIFARRHPLYWLITRRVMKKKLLTEADHNKILYFSRDLVRTFYEISWLRMSQYGRFYRTVNAIRGFLK